MSPTPRETFRIGRLQFLAQPEQISVQIVMPRRECASLFLHTEWPERINTKKIIEVIDHWHVVESWWNPERYFRSYFQVVLETGRIMTLFQDMETNEWFTQLTSKNHSQYK